jgi:hypothetical protein
MAYDRPNKGPKVRDKFSEPSGQPMFTQGGDADGSFFQGFDNLHSASFKANASTGSTVKTESTTPKIEHLAFLVKTLADLQFITKGKVDSDGKVELMFCSPEPVVTQVASSVTEPAKNRVRFEEVETKNPEIRYIERPPSRSHAHRKKRTSFF